MRTRFAPSPTGLLHVGGLRTALYAWLIARQHDGAFLLRIEDTDKTREVPGATEGILRALAWANIQPDEGVVLDEHGVVAQSGAHGPYLQSERLHIYAQYADRLLESGHAYRCFCTAERLEHMRAEQQANKRPPMYDRTCLQLNPGDALRRAASGEKHVIRLMMPRDEVIAFDDDIRGRVEFQGSLVDDQVLMKSDGFPTYHLAHVVDDHLMDIDLVLRGEEWLSSTPKHLALFTALGWRPPRYAHVPLLLNRDKTKLSKRQSAVAVEDYRAKGYLPEALLNFIALLGWNPGTVEELFSQQDLIERFSVDRIQKAGAVFDTDKLDWLQGQWMRRLTPKEFAERIRPLVAKAHPAAANDAAFQEKAALIQDRITFFHEAPDMLGFLYEDPAVPVDLLANKKQKVSEEDLPRLLSVLHDTLDPLPEDQWTKERLEADLRSAATMHECKLGQLLWPLRAALTGRPFSPGAFEVAAILGKEATMRRLRVLLH